MVSFIPCSLLFLVYSHLLYLLKAFLVLNASLENREINLQAKPTNPFSAAWALPCLDALSVPECLADVPQTTNSIESMCPGSSQVAVGFLDLICSCARAMQPKHYVGSTLVCKIPACVLRATGAVYTQRVDATDYTTDKMWCNNIQKKPRNIMCLR